MFLYNSFTCTCYDFGHNKVMNMKTNQQKSNWILDALLFVGFLVSFAMDWTGLSLHQWIGVFGGLLAIYHLVLHWDWVTAVTMRFFGKTSAQARTYYLLDASIMLGFYLILVTGVVISTWLNLALTNYAVWVDFHVTTSIVTLLLVVLKIGLHWRWIVRVARQSIFRPAPQPTPMLKPAPVPVAASGTMTRRDFLKLMGVVGVASLAAFTFTLNNNQQAQAAAGTSDTDATTSTTTSQEVVQPTASSPTATSESVAVAEATPSATTETVTVAQSYAAPSTTTVTTSCVVRCDKQCSSPGRCRRYQDSNGNNLCDLGECM